MFTTLQWCFPVFFFCFASYRSFRAFTRLFLLLRFFSSNCRRRRRFFGTPAVFYFSQMSFYVIVLLTVDNGDRWRRQQQATFTVPHRFSFDTPLSVDPGQSCEVPSALRASELLFISSTIVPNFFRRCHRHNFVGLFSLWHPNKRDFRDD